MMLSCKVSLAMHNAFFLPYLSSSFLFLKMVENLCEDVTYKMKKKKEMWIVLFLHFGVLRTIIKCNPCVFSAKFGSDQWVSPYLVWWLLQSMYKTSEGEQKISENAGTSLLHRKLLSTETKRVKKCFVSSTFVTAREGDAYSFQKTMVFRVAPSPAWSTILTTAESLLKDYLLSHLLDVILQL